MELTISQLAEYVGTTADTIRYYEHIGLLPPPPRSRSGYRLFSEEHAERLRFVREAQQLGLQLDAIRELLEIRERGLCPCGHARRLLTARLQDLEEQLAALTRLCDDIRGMIDGDGVAGSSWPCGNQLLQIDPRPRSDP